MIRVLVVEDNPILREEVIFFLSLQGHQVKGVGDGVAMDRELSLQHYDIVILDIGLPGEDGYSIAKRLAQRPGLGILALTARGATDDRIRGLRSGMDAYLVKPADLRELLALVERLFERISGSREGGGAEVWRLDPLRRCIRTPDGTDVPLTANETAILTVMAKAHGAAVSRRDIIIAMGRNYMEFDDRRLEVAISRLRRKLMPDSPSGSPIRADRGTGYCFAANLVIAA
ncbi:MAG TPA: response regulator transcription factor [Rhodocyclaceae bacterium]|nr:response regulator transcription factor [Rhodocyclaceae bacterium]